MWHCDLTFPTPEENLACDEVLLDRCESGSDQGILRFWQSPSYFVVVGYANRVAREVNLSYCQQHAIPVLRRCSGGGTVLQGPGCLNYSLILPTDAGTQMRGITSTNDFIMRQHQEVLTSLLAVPVDRQGHTDLTIHGLKFSGNAQRRRHRCLLFHGSFLLQFDLALIEKTLPMPSHQPNYRANRSHQDFLMNLELPDHVLKSSLIEAWGATSPLPHLPVAETKALALEKYSQAEWNLKF